MAAKTIDYEYIGALLKEERDFELHANHDTNGFLMSLFHFTHAGGMMTRNLKRTLKKNEKESYSSKEDEIRQRFIAYAQLSRKRPGNAQYPEYQPRVIAALPYLESWINAFSASYQYLSRHEREDLERLVEIRLSPLPVVAFYGGVIKDGSEPSFDVSGAEFFIYLNLMRNAYGHGIGIPNDDQTICEVEHNPTAGYTSFTNLSHERMPVSDHELTQQGHYGVFIAKLYAIAMGGRLDYQSTNYEAISDGKSLYQTTATYWHDATQAPLAA